MYLTIPENTIAAFVCTGPTHLEPEILTFAAQKGKAALSDADVRIALTSVATEHGWRINFLDTTSLKGNYAVVLDLCPRCGVETAKVELGKAKKRFEDPDLTDDDQEDLADKIRNLDAYLGMFDLDRKNVQPDLPLDGAYEPGTTPEEAETAYNEAEPVPDEEPEPVEVDISRSRSTTRENTTMDAPAPVLEPTPEDPAAKVAELVKGMAHTQTDELLTAIRAQEQMAPGGGRDCVRSSQMHSCMRRMFFDTVMGHHNKWRDCARQSRMDIGNRFHDLYKPKIEAWANANGWWRYVSDDKTARGQESSFKLYADGVPYLTGHVDMMLTDGILVVPVEIKSMVMGLFDRMESLEDLLANRWTHHYLDQLLGYMWCYNSPVGLFILISLNGETSLPFLDKMAPDEAAMVLDDAASRFVVTYDEYQNRMVAQMDKAIGVSKAIQRYRQGDEDVLTDGTLPYCNDPTLCEDCWARKIKYCDGAPRPLEGPSLVESEELAKLLDRFVVIDEEGRERERIYNKIKDKITFLFVDRPKVELAFVGRHVLRLQHKVYKRKAIEAVEKDIVSWKVATVEGPE